MYNTLQCLPGEVNYAYLYIRFGTWKVRRLTRSRSTVKIPMWAYVGYWNVIHGLTKIRYVGRNRFKRRSFHVLNEEVRLGTWKCWKVRRLNWAWVGIIELKIERMPQIHLKLRFCRRRRPRISRSLLVKLEANLCQNIKKKYLFCLPKFK